MEAVAVVAVHLARQARILIEPDRRVPGQDVIEVRGPKTAPDMANDGVLPEFHNLLETDHRTRLLAVPESELLSIAREAP